MAKDARIAESSRSTRSLPDQKTLDGCSQEVKVCNKLNKRLTPRLTYFICRKGSKTFALNSESTFERSNSENCIMNSGR